MAKRAKKKATKLPREQRRKMTKEEGLAWHRDTIIECKCNDFWVTYKSPYPWTQEELKDLRAQLYTKPLKSVEFIAKRISYCATRQEIDELLSGIVEEREEQRKELFRQLAKEGYNMNDVSDVETDSTATDDDTDDDSESDSDIFNCLEGIDDDYCV